jgi:hypothetical protein
MLLSFIFHLTQSVNCTPAQKHNQHSGGTIIFVAIPVLEGRTDEVGSPAPLTRSARSSKITPPPGVPPLAELSRLSGLARFEAILAASTQLLRR